MQIEKVSSIERPSRFSLNELQQVARLVIQLQYASEISQEKREINQNEVAELNGYLFDWAEENNYFGLPAEKLNQILDKIRMSELVLATNYSLDKETKKVLASFFTWLFLRDDLVDERVESDVMLQAQQVKDFNQVCFSVLHESAHSSLPTLDNYAESLVSSFEVIVNQLYQRMSPVWQERFAEVVTQEFSANVAEVMIRAQQTPIELDEYAYLRRQFSLTKVLFVTVLGLHDFPVPDEIYHDKKFQEILDKANNLMSWVNDFASVGKNILDGDPLDLIQSLQHTVQPYLECLRDISELQEELPLTAEIMEEEVLQNYAQGLSLSHAAELSISLHDHEVREFLNAVEGFSDSHPDEKDRENLEQVWRVLYSNIQGNLSWSQMMLKNGLRYSQSQVK